MLTWTRVAGTMLHHLFFGQLELRFLQTDVLWTFLKHSAGKRGQIYLIQEKEADLWSWRSRFSSVTFESLVRTRGSSESAFFFFLASTCFVHQIYFLMRTYRKSPETRVPWRTRFPLFALQRSQILVKPENIAAPCVSLCRDLMFCDQINQLIPGSASSFPFTHSFSWFSWSSIFPHFSRLALHIKNSSFILCSCKRSTVLFSTAYFTMLYIKGTF